MNYNQRHSDDIAYFLAFCIEIYKNANHMGGAEVSRLFCSTGLDDFLTDNYGPIHTQSPQWILEEINEYLSAHKSHS